MNSKISSIGLGIVLHLVLVSFVFFSLYYAETKFLGAQNVNQMKELKRIQLFVEAMQIAPNNFSGEYGIINHSILISNDDVQLDALIRKISLDLPRYDDDFSFNCRVDLGVKEIEEKYEREKKFIEFLKTGREIKCNQEDQ